MKPVGVDVSKVIEQVHRRRDGAEGDEGNDDVSNDVVVTQDAGGARGDRDESVLHPLARAHRREESVSRSPG